MIKHRYKIAVFEESGCAQRKIEGIRRFAPEILLSPVIDLPHINKDIVIDEPEEFLQEDFDADMVLNYIKHPDLSYFLTQICKKKGVPVVASGQKIKGAICPFTCCGLGYHKSIEYYSKRFGFPEYRVYLSNNKIKDIKVIKGAPCGASWDIKEGLLGLNIEDALVLVGRLVQYHCTANPSAFDPITQKSAVHFAGKVHQLALKKGIKNY